MAGLVTPQPADCSTAVTDGPAGDLALWPDGPALTMQIYAIFVKSTHTVSGVVTK